MMKKILKLALKNRYFWLILPILTFSACEEVIEIDLNSSTPKIVAEGLIEKDSVGWLKLSYTTNYFATENPTYINDATVVLTDKFGNSETFSNEGNGLYKGTVLKGVENNKYTIHVNGLSTDLNAVSELNPPVTIQSLAFSKQEIQRPGQSFSNYALTINFSDDQTTKNFYLLRFSVNNTIITNSYTCITDENYAKNGNLEYTPWNLRLLANDNIIVSVYSIDEGVYTYLNQINDISSGMGSWSTPYNAKSNFGSNALGYFKAWSYVSKSAIVQE